MNQRFFVAEAKEFNNYKGLAEREGDWVIQEYSQSGFMKKVGELERLALENYGYGKVVQCHKNFTVLFYLVPAFSKYLELGEYESVVRDFYEHTMERFGKGGGLF